MESFTAQKMAFKSWAATVRANLPNALEYATANSFWSVIDTGFPETVNNICHRHILVRSSTNYSKFNLLRSLKSHGYLFVEDYLEEIQSSEEEYVQYAHKEEEAGEMSAKARVIPEDQLYEMAVNLKDASNASIRQAIREMGVKITGVETYFKALKILISDLDVPQLLFEIEPKDYFPKYIYKNWTDHTKMKLMNPSGGMTMQKLWEQYVVSHCIKRPIKDGMRGIMFGGEPGTGKTTLCSTLKAFTVPSDSNGVGRFDVPNDEYSAILEDWTLDLLCRSDNDTTIRQMCLGQVVNVKIQSTTKQLNPKWMYMTTNASYEEFEATSDKAVKDRWWYVQCNNVYRSTEEENFMNVDQDKSRKYMFDLFDVTNHLNIQFKQKYYTDKQSKI